MKKQHHKQQKGPKSSSPSPTAPQPTHPMVESRLTACITTLGLGGIGIGLTATHVVPIVGFAASMICAVLASWIYLKPAQAIVRSIGSKQPYKGPPTLREVTIAYILIFGLVLISAIVLPIGLSEPIDLHHARVELWPIERVKLPSDSPVGSIWTRLHNAGDLDAVDLISLLKGHIAAAPMPLEKATAELDAMEKILYSLPAATRTVLTKTQDQPVTLQDFDTGKWQDIISQKLAPPKLEFTDAQWEDFLHGKSVIYVFAVATYRDESLKENERWKLRFCGYFAQSTSFWHNCAKNVAEKVTVR